MEKIIYKLKIFADKNLYEWQIPHGCPIDIPDSLQTEFDKNVYLKENFYKLPKDEQEKHFYWIIQEWGGIKSFKRSEKNDERIKKFLNELNKLKVGGDSFSCISSLSKIASFTAPQNYAIYDSRVIYSLNWLLFNYTDEYELFPQPNGRNVELSKYNLDTIFRLTKRNFSYINNSQAYIKYCNLLKELTPKIYGENGEIYMLEMLLFTIADSAIVKELEKSVSMNIDTNVLLA